MTGTATGNAAGNEAGHGLPAGLRQRVLTASLQARRAGRAVPAVAEISPVEAFRRAAAALDATLGGLAAADWRRPALRDMDVQGLVGHLIGVEEDVRRALGGDPAVAAVEHRAATEAAVRRQHGVPPSRTRSQWRRAAAAVAAQAEATVAAQAQARAAGGPGSRGQAAGRDADGVIAVHGLRVPLGTLLVIRAFELWTHENDIRAAVGQPRSAPDPPVLALMTDLAARLLPLGAARTGLASPVALRLVLTGPGGGTWDVDLPAAAAGTDPNAAGPDPNTAGPDPNTARPDPNTARPDQNTARRDRMAAEPVRIVAGAVEFCRLVADRAAAADLDAEISGDRGRAAGVLAAAAALALD